MKYLFQTQNDELQLKPKIMWNFYMYMCLQKTATIPFSVKMKRRKKRQHNMQVNVYLHFSALII